MNFGTAFLFNEPGEAALRAVWQALADAGLSSFMLGLDYPPHMTAWMAQEFTLPALRGTLQALAADQPPLRVEFPALGVFPGEMAVTYLAPIASPPLLGLHARYWEAALPYMRSPLAHYSPGRWVPHVTVGFNLPPGVLGDAVEVLSRATWPQEAVIDGLIFGEFHVSGGSVLETIRFGGGERIPPEREK